MTKIAYLECPTGIAGDMCLGALVHAGVPLDYLDQHLRKMGVQDEFRLWAETVNRNGQAATKVHVDLLKGDGSEFGTFSGAVSEEPAAPHIPSGADSPPPEPTNAAHGAHRHLPDIERLIQAANLPARAQAWSLAVFRQLAAAEAAVHGISIDRVHFHEVGATDALVDIVGTCLGLDWLNLDAIYCSALPMGGGVIRAAHGFLPVPAPAVLKLWELGQVPVYSNGIERELVTPTGAALVTTLAQGFGAPPPLRVQAVGLGAGNRDLPLPNILRLWIGEPWDITRSTVATQSRSTVFPSRQSAPGHTPALPPATEPAQDHSHDHDHAHPHDHPHDHDHSHGHAHPHDHAPSQDHPQDYLHEHAHTYLHPMYHEPSAPTWDVDETPATVMVLETQVDDLSPQAIAYTQDALFAAGALDVFCGAIAMKKSRLGTLITVICPPHLTETCEAILFRETTTLGIRRQPQQRTILQRHREPIETTYGTVHIKVAHRAADSSVLNAHPEYEDCAALARQHNIPWQQVHRSALHQWETMQEMHSEKTNS